MFLEAGRILNVHGKKGGSNQPAALPLISLVLPSTDNHTYVRVHATRPKTAYTRKMYIVYISTKQPCEPTATVQCGTPEANLYDRITSTVSYTL
jgi:hypothetical protein